MVVILAPAESTDTLYQPIDLPVIEAFNPAQDRQMFFSSDNKDRKRYEKLITPHVSQLYSLACRLCRNKADAEDITQDLLVKLFGKLDTLSKLDNLRPYLFRALHNQYIDHLRRNNKHTNTIDMDIDEELPVETADSHQPDTITENSITLEMVDKALGELPENHRNIIVLHDAEGFTYDEISVMLDIPPGTAKSRHHRARAALKAKL